MTVLSFTGHALEDQGRERRVDCNILVNDYGVAPSEGKLARFNRVEFADGAFTSRHRHGVFETSGKGFFLCDC